ncbi:MAG: hypothetical protein COB49_06420 [Alphaproteobacteria bacterium]|nr:MAG: hypothetical protein COB49_06420 [Alphaproteobacteria bacterium]
MNSNKSYYTAKRSKLVRKVSFYKFLINYITHTLLRSLAKRNSLKGYPKLLSLPSDYIGQHIISNGLYEEHLLKGLFDKFFTKYLIEFSENTVLDIGANIGNHSCFFSNYFNSVLAFEPNDTVFAILKANIVINNIKNITAKNFGLSDKDAELTFIENTDGNLGGSGFCKKSHEMRGIRKLLPVRKGDTIIEGEFGNNQIKLIKIDVEGHELAVLQGLKNTIHKFHPIILFETNTSEGEHGGQVIFDFLKDSGYKYFYSVETMKSTLRFRFLRILERVFKGYNIYAKEIYAPENRPYSLIVATHSEMHFE